MTLFRSIVVCVCASLGFAGAAQAQQPLCEVVGFPTNPANLVAWWPFDETSGATADEVMSGLHGQINFQTVANSFVNGQLAGAYHFGNASGINEVVVPHNPLLNFDSMTDFTIDAFINYELVPGLLPTATIFQKGEPQAGYGFYLTGSLHLLFIMWAPGSFSASSQTTSPVFFSPPNWPHVAVRVRRTTGSAGPAGVSFFINGTKVAATPFSLAALKWDVSNNGDAIIGRRAGYFHEFYLDEVEVLNRAPTDNQMFELISPGKCKPIVNKLSPGPTNVKVTCAPLPPDLDAWYPLDGDGTELVLGNDATAVGNVSFPAGMVHGALDANKGHMSVPHTSVLNQGMGDFSIDAWVKFQPKTDSKARHLIGKRKYVSDADVVGYVVYVWENRFGLQLADGQHTNRNDPRHVTDGEWHHFAVTVDRDNPQGIIFYVDGVPGAPRDPTSRQGNLDNTEPLTIGLADLDVQLDEVEFFDRNLLPSEIKAIFDAGATGKCK